MITVTLHPNGFLIRGHAHPTICGQVSILAWSCANMIAKHDKHCDWYTADHDDRPDVGYTHLEFNNANVDAKWLFNMFKQNIEVWSEFYDWQKDDHVTLVYSNESLVIPNDFKEQLGIVPVSTASE